MALRPRYFLPLNLPPPWFCVQVKMPGGVRAVGTMLLQARGCTGLSTKPGTAPASGKWVYTPVLPVHYRLRMISFSGIYKNKLWI